ncbi:MAG: DUF1592 domain-containing protein [Archangium sp.]
MRRLAPAALILLTGCMGELVGPRADVVTPPGTTTEILPDGGTRVLVDQFTCDPNASTSPEVVLRLTPDQYENALRGLLGRAFTTAQVDAALSSSAVAPKLAAIPDDGSTHRAELTYDSMDQRISPLLVEPQFDVATALGEWIANDPARLATFTRRFGGATACATPASQTCADAVIEGLGRVALRRAVDDEDRAQYRGVYGDTTYGGHAALIASFLVSPDFLFRTEFRGTELDGRSDLTALTSFEIANRLAFALTNAPPDDALLDAAAADFTGAGLTLDEQVTRLLSSPQAKGQFEHFFRQWLRLDRVSGINPSAVSSLSLMYPDSSAPSLPMTTDLQQLRLDAFEEMVELMTFSAEHGTLRDALTSDVSFARSADLARVYGVQPWSGDENALVHFPTGQRAGLFTRAGYLLSGYPDTNPVMRGARLRVEYLCDAMEPPANTTPPASYMPPAVLTVRNVVEAKTQIPGTACQGCHQSSINPLGFPFESYDAFGRFRTQEALFLQDGSVGSWVAVNSTTRPDLDRNGGAATVTDGVAMSGLLADSQRVSACYARHTFRYVTGRKEVSATDGCTLNAMERAASTKSLRDVVRALATSSDFTRRRMPPGN